ncbi:MAG: AAA family ATPase [Candidatus Cybelea sp.]
MELRAKGTRKGVQSGYFDNPRALARAAFELHTQGAPGVYVTINTVDPVLLARGPNLLRTYAKETTKDEDILKRCWLPIDIDSRRKSGISATKEEHEAAIVRATYLVDYLCEQRGWPRPLIVDSGNGANLFFPIDLANDDASKTLVRTVLGVLARRFDDEAVLIDQGVYNAARLMKLPGTTARKGADMPDRPHRCSQILDGLEECTPDAIVSAAQLQALVAEDHYSPSATRQVAHIDFDLEHALAGMTVKRGPDPYQVFGGVAQRWIVQCPFVPEHGGTTAAVIRMPTGATVFKCHGNRCRERTWADVMELLRNEPFDISGTNLRRRSPSAERANLRLLRASEVESKPIRWLMRGRIPRDELTLLDGDGGIGKTTVATDIIGAVTSVRALPDGSRRGPWPCIIVAEENRRDHLKEMLKAAGADLPICFFLTADDSTFQIPDHISQLREFVQETNAQLVYIDSLFNHFGTRAGTPLNPDRPIDARCALTPLVELAHEGLTIVATRHWTKTAQGAKHRGFGSADVTNVARSVLSFAPHPSSEGTYVIAVAKPGLSQTVDALTYAIESAPVCDDAGFPIIDEDSRQWTVPRIRWLGTERIRADSLSMANPQTADECAAEEDADDAILQTLALGPLLAEDFRSRVLTAGVGTRAFERRRARLRGEGHIERSHGGGDLSEPWSWSLTESGRARLAKSRSSLPSSSPISPWPWPSDLGGSMAT